MSKFAIIKVGASQYTVEEGKTYSIPKFGAEEGKAYKVAEVLAAGDEKDTQFGTPTLAKAQVELDILAQEKGEKVKTTIYKAKSRYKKTRGFRKEVTRFKVAKIIY